MPIIQVLKAKNKQWNKRETSALCKSATPSGYKREREGIWMRLIEKQTVTRNGVASGKWWVPPAAHKSVTISIGKFTDCIKNAFTNADKLAQLPNEMRTSTVAQWLTTPWLWLRLHLTPISFPCPLLDMCHLCTWHLISATQRGAAFNWLVPPETATHAVSNPPNVHLVLQLQLDFHL